MARIIREPIYQQVVNALRELLTQNFAPGDKFLTERDIADRYDVSRPTANKCLSALVSEGLLDFRKGVGTFVKERGLSYDMRELLSFSAMARAQGKRASTQVLALDVVKQVDDAVSDALGTSDCWLLERLRLVDEAPVSLERRWLPRELYPDLHVGALSGSVYALLSERYGLTVGGTEQDIIAHNCDEREAGLLQVAPGAAGLVVSALGRERDSRPLWFERTLYRGDAFSLSVKIGQHHQPQPISGRLLE